MLHQIGLVLTVAIGFALGVDLLGSRARRRALVPFGLMALVVAVWAGGELWLLAADGPAEVLAARRLVFLGPCFFSPLWLWAAWSATGRSIRGVQVAVVAGIAALEAVAYSFLWWDRSGAFVDWYALPPERGPVFLAHALLAWSVVGAGLVLWLRYAVRASDADPLPRAAAAAAAVAPVVANVVYLGLGFPSFDPTPLVLGAVAVVFRTVVLGGTFAPYFVSFGRAELLDQLDAGILVADVTGRVVESNAAARRLTATPRPSGQSLETLLSRARSLAGEGLAWREFPLRRRAAFAGRGAVLFDRRDDRLREQGREVERRLAGLGFLASGVAHEINNPLTYVLADVEALEAIVDELGREPGPDGVPSLRRRGLAREGLELVQESRDGLQRIEQTVAFLSGLAARQQRGAPGAVSLQETVAQAVDMARLGQAGRIHVVQRGEPPAVWAVAEDVVQIVLQLLTNALEVDPEGDVELRLSPSPGGAAVEVLDRGAGMGESQLAHVFDPYFTTKSPDGRGLGLSFAHELARRHGGELTAENRPEGGACFRLWLLAAD